MFQEKSFMLIICGCGFLINILLWKFNTIYLPSIQFEGLTLFLIFRCKKYNKKILELLENNLCCVELKIHNRNVAFLISFFFSLKKMNDYGFW